MKLTTFLSKKNEKGSDKHLERLSPLKKHCLKITKCEGHHFKDKSISNSYDHIGPSEILR